MTDRRTLLAGLGGASLLAPFLALERAAARLADPAARLAAANARAETAHEDLMAVPNLRMHGQEQVAMLMYPGFTALDLVGPHYFFGGMMGATVHLVTTEDDLKPVASDLGLAIEPTIRMADVPAQLDVIFAPGGTMGTLAAMKREDVVDFVADRGGRARYVTSVCTGSLILGQAGLLDSRRATSHWAAHDLLPEFGAIPVDDRVVTDDNRITGAGVSAGLDFGLALVAAMRGEPYAKALMLSAEYAPAPPFPGGTLAATPDAIGDAMAGMFAGTVEGFRQVAADRRR